VIKIHASWAKKVGRPNYSSDDARCAIEAEFSDALIAQPRKLLREIRNLYAIVESAVEAQLSEDRNREPGDDDDLAELSAGMDDAPPPKPAIAANGNGNHALPAPKAPPVPVVAAPSPRTAGEPIPPRKAANGDRVPTSSGAEFYRWLSDRGLVNAASEIGARNNWPRMVTHWQPAYLVAAYAELTRPPAPSANGNGRHSRSGAYASNGKA